MQHQMRTKRSSVQAQKETHKLSVEFNSVITKFTESDVFPEQNCSFHQLCPTPEALTLE